MDTTRNPAPKIDIKSELYHAVAPRVARLSQVAWVRFRELPKWDVIKNFLTLYLVVGFILEGILANLPSSGLMAYLGLPMALINNVLAVSVLLFWPFITWKILGLVDHTALSLSILFIAATYTSHLR